MVELMIVVGIIALLAAISVPSFVRARTQSQTNACINNLRQIDDASQEWALDNHKSVTSPVAYSDVQAYLRHGVTCPAAGDGTAFDDSYLLTTVSNKPTCKIWPSTHALQADIASGPPRVRPVP